MDSVGNSCLLACIYTHVQYPLICILPLGITSLQPIFSGSKRFSNPCRTNFLWDSHIHHPAPDRIRRTCPDQSARIQTPRCTASFRESVLPRPYDAHIPDSCPAVASDRAATTKGMTYGYRLTVHRLVLCHHLILHHLSCIVSVVHGRAVPRMSDRSAAAHHSRHSRHHSGLHELSAHGRLRIGETRAVYSARFSDSP